MRMLRVLHVKRNFPSRGYASAATAAGTLRRTVLYETHVKNGGTMVEFGGFQMPVQYKGLSISDSVLWTRNKASLFDVPPFTDMKLMQLGRPYGST
jgi:aminomethyltransferase